jgi:hypothetical protein
LFLPKSGQGQKIKRSVIINDPAEWFALIRCRVQLASYVLREAIEREESCTGEKRAEALIAGATDGRCHPARNTERDIIDEADRHLNGVDSDEPMYKKDDEG